MKKTIGGSLVLMLVGVGLAADTASYKLLKTIPIPGDGGWDYVNVDSAGRRVFVVGTGTSWHAANHGAYFLQLAGADAFALSAADCALWGPRPSRSEALVLLSHRGTKRYTGEVLERARADGVPTVAIGGEGAPGIDIETVTQETSATFTASAPENVSDAPIHPSLRQ